jgi:hypothetical protein
MGARVRRVLSPNLFSASAEQTMSQEVELETAEGQTLDSRLARVVSGEDLNIGDDVAVLNESIEFPSCFWDCDFGALSPYEPVRVRYSSRNPGVPYRVEAICLPFVFLKSPDKTHRTIDTRLVQLVRLSGEYARCVRKATGR